MKPKGKPSADASTEGNGVLWVTLACSVALHFGVAGLAPWRNENIQPPVYGVTEAAGAAGDLVKTELESGEDQPEAVDATASSPAEPTRDVAVEPSPSPNFSPPSFEEPPPVTSTAIRETEKASPRPPASPSREPRPPIITASPPRDFPGGKPSRGSSFHRVAATAGISSSGAGGTGGAAPVVGRGPAYLSNEPPPYPPRARQAGQQGLVLLWVSINERGKVADLRLQRSSGSPELDDAALRTVRGWRFRPATRGEVPVPAAIRVPVRFRLDE